MTLAQRQQANETLKELQKLAPAVTWFVSYNYYTKLPQFSAVKDGSVSFSMHKRERYQNYKKLPNSVELDATVDPAAKLTDTGLLVSGTYDIFKMPKASITETLERVNFKKYLEFVKSNLSILEQIGA